MIRRHAFRLAALICAATAAVGAQPSGTTASPADLGAIVRPPDVDREAVKPAPRHVDPEIAVSPGQEPRKPEPAVKRKRSKEADCKGPAELCRQSRPK